LPQTFASQEITRAADALPNFTALVKAAGPAVVNLKTTKKTATGSPPPASRDIPDGGGDDLSELFRRLIPPESRGRGAPSLGSGFIISADGLILTDSHLIENSAEITVRLTDGRTFKAKVLGTDAHTDVALLKVDAANLPVVKVGDPDKLEVGEWVLAIGSPFGFENTVTQGIVSAKGRALPDEHYIPFIQTDVPINPGSSGGPLFNLAGEVVGINSQIYTRSGGYMGLAFAIPIDLAMRIKDELLAHGKVYRGRLGIGHQSVDEATATAFRLSEPKGALITEVEKNGPGHRAGLMAGDVIREFDAVKIDNSNQLPRLVAGAKPGTRVTIKIWRKGKSEIVQATLGELTADAKTGSRDSESEPPLDQLGLALRELTMSEKRELQMEEGLMVARVAGEAARAGVLEGDVILGVNDNRVTSVKQFRQLVGQSNQIAALLVSRGNNVIYVPLRTKAS
jgi:serine protease Do